MKYNLIYRSSTKEKLNKDMELSKEEVTQRIGELIESNKVLKVKIMGCE